jgi:hypothetical protein
VNLAAIRAGLKANITAVITDAHMTGYLMTPVVSPGFEVDTVETQFDTTYRRGTDEIDLVVRGWLSLNETDESQKRMDNWIDGTAGESVKAAIESDKTLGGACDACRVTRAAVKRAMPVDANALYLVGEWTVHVIGTPS